MHLAWRAGSRGDRSTSSAGTCIFRLISERRTIDITSFACKDGKSDANADLQTSQEGVQ